MDTSPTNRTVLCIEDEHFISDLYARALTKAGYQTTVVGDGTEGLKQAQSNSFDIILLDLMLPQLSGMELLRQLRGPEAPPLRSKVIITTNLDVKEDVRQELESMADGYIIKADLTPHQLVDFLNLVKIEPPQPAA